MCNAARQRSSRFFTITAVTVANGSDNLTVYTPLFARNPHRIPLYVAVFAMLTALWCLVGYLLTNHLTVGQYMRRVSRVALPWVMMLIGLWLMSDIPSPLRQVLQ